MVLIFQDEAQTVYNPSGTDVWDADVAGWADTIERFCAPEYAQLCQVWRPSDMASGLAPTEATSVCLPDNRDLPDGWTWDNIVRSPTEAQCKAVYDSAKGGAGVDDPTGLVLLGVDASGSMYESTLGAGYSDFKDYLTSIGVEWKQVLFTNERWFQLTTENYIGVFEGTNVLEVFPPCGTCIDTYVVGTISPPGCATFRVTDNEFGRLPTSYAGDVHTDPYGYDDRFEDLAAPFPAPDPTCPTPPSILDYPDLWTRVGDISAALQDDILQDDCYCLGEGIDRNTLAIGRPQFPRVTPVPFFAFPNVSTTSINVREFNPDGPPLAGDCCPADDDVGDHIIAEIVDNEIQLTRNKKLTDFPELYRVDDTDPSFQVVAGYPRNCCMVDPCTESGNVATALIHTPDFTPFPHDQTIVIAVGGSTVLTVRNDTGVAYTATPTLSGVTHTLGCIGPSTETQYFAALAYLLNQLDDVSASADGAVSVTITADEKETSTYDIVVTGTAVDPGGHFVITAEAGNASDEFVLRDLHFPRWPGPNSVTENRDADNVDSVRETRNPYELVEADREEPLGVIPVVVDVQCHTDGKVYVYYANIVVHDGHIAGLQWHVDPPRPDNLSLWAGNEPPGPPENLSVNVDYQDREVFDPFDPIAHPSQSQPWCEDTCLQAAVQLGKEDEACMPVCPAESVFCNDGEYQIISLGFGAAEVDAVDAAFENAEDDTPADCKEGGADPEPYRLCYVTWNAEVGAYEAAVTFCCDDLSSSAESESSSA
jgi:hypothetical protein